MVDVKSNIWLTGDVHHMTMSGTDQELLDLNNETVGMLGDYLSFIVYLCLV